MRLTATTDLVTCPRSATFESVWVRCSVWASESYLLNLPVQIKHRIGSLTSHPGSFQLNGHLFCPVEPRNLRVGIASGGLWVKWWSRGLSAGLIKRGPVNSRTPCQVSDMRPAQAEVNHRASGTIKAKRPKRRNVRHE